MAGPKTPGRTTFEPKDANWVLLPEVVAVASSTTGGDDLKYPLQTLVSLFWSVITYAMVPWTRGPPSAFEFVESFAGRQLT